MSLVNILKALLSLQLVLYVIGLFVLIVNRGSEGGYGSLEALLPIGLFFLLMPLTVVLMLVYAIRAYAKHAPSDRVLLGLFLVVVFLGFGLGPVISLAK